MAEINTLILSYFNCFLTCCKAALASKASEDSFPMDTREVGVPAVGMAAGEHRGVEVRVNSSGCAPGKSQH